MYPPSHPYASMAARLGTSPHNKDGKAAGRRQEAQLQERRSSVLQRVMGWGYNMVGGTRRYNDELDDFEDGTKAEDENEFDFLRRTQRESRDAPDSDDGSDDEDDGAEKRAAKLSSRSAS